MDDDDVLRSPPEKRSFPWTVWSFFGTPPRSHHLLLVVCCRESQFFINFTFTRVKLDRSPFCESNNYINQTKLNAYASSLWDF